ncbi:RSVR protein, partial [Malurus elegans]|nr:RSVR protein [Malurus elegans]
PDQLQCVPGAPCFPGEWRCDGHPDCDDGGDEWGCETATSAEPSPGGPEVTLPRSSAVSPADSAGTVPRVSGSLLVHSAGLLSILVAAGSVAVWGLSKAKSISNTFSLEKASREQLMPDKSQ